MILVSLRRSTAEDTDSAADSAPNPESMETLRQGLLWNSTAYDDEAATIRSAAEWAGAIEHLQYAIFRRYQNQLTRGERARLDNTIRNAMYKMERYLERLDHAARSKPEAEYLAAREAFVDGQERAERLRRQGRRAEAKLAQLDTLTPEGFEEFVGELFDALGYTVELVGGTGDEGADLRLARGGLEAVVQCKYRSRGVVGSPELQKFLGTIHHHRCRKGFFVTTRTFSIAAERFAADHPIELIDGPRLVELVKEALGPCADREPDPVWF
jgi:restriction system protein